MGCTNTTMVSLNVTKWLDYLLNICPFWNNGNFLLSKSNLPKQVQNFAQMLNMPSKNFQVWSHCSKSTLLVHQMMTSPVSFFPNRSVLKCTERDRWLGGQYLMDNVCQVQVELSGHNVRPFQYKDSSSKPIDYVMTKMGNSSACHRQSGLSRLSYPWLVTCKVRQLSDTAQLTKYQCDQISLFVQHWTIYNIS